MRGILTYHSIDDSGSPISLDEATFERHVRFLASGSVCVLPLAELLAADSARDAVAITFDDGFRNFATTAWPVLRDHDLPVTLFVVTGHLGLDNRWCGRQDPSVVTLDLLDWEELTVLAEQGIDVGSHTRSHPWLPQLDDDALAAEIRGSAADIEHRTGHRPSAFCFPFGACDARVVDLVTATYDHACTTELRPLSPRDSLYQLPRLDCHYLRSRGRLEQWGTPQFRAYLRVRGLGRQLKGALTRQPRTSR